MGRTRLGERKGREHDRGKGEDGEREEKTAREKEITGKSERERTS